MDAKPQRIRVRGDENAPMAFAANKTLHQRNKSATALAGTFQNGPPKNNGPRRAAFGDVSNTANPVHGSRDGAALAGKKQITKGAANPTVKIPERKSNVLAQPPQRPTSVSNLKGILNQPKAQQKLLEPAGKQTTLSQQTANTRKTLNKRGTTIFKDPAQSMNEIKDEVTASKETKPHASDVSTEDILRPSTALSLDDKEGEDNAAQVPLENLQEHYDADDCAVMKSDSIDAEAETSFTADENDCNAQKLEESKLHESHAVVHSHPHSVPLPEHEQEPEEYWNDEEDENEEDDGYVTARSYRSRGDNTTGGITAVLFPKYNQQVRRELALAKEIVEATRPEEDVEDEFWDTSMVAEYSDEIFDFMKEQELKMLPNAHYMDYQVEIQWSMRSILMDWLVQVHHRFGLLPETLYLCVNYVDRFLSSKIISLDRIQLVGATALFIAAKYEEINCPSVWEVVFMVEQRYTAERILEAERLMLYVLRFELGWPGPMSFLRRISKADDYDLETRTMAKYFLELTIMDERFVSSPPSFLAAGAHCLARLMLGKGDWSAAHIHYSGYTYSQLLPLVSVLLECCENPGGHHAFIFEKYADKRYKRASLFVQAEMQYFRLPQVSRDSSVYKRNGLFGATHY